MKTQEEICDQNYEVAEDDFDKRHGIKKVHKKVDWAKLEREANFKSKFVERLFARREKPMRGSYY